MPPGARNTMVRPAPFAARMANGPSRNGRALSQRLMHGPTSLPGMRPVALTRLTFVNLVAPSRSERFGRTRGVRPSASAVSRSSGSGCSLQSRYGAQPNCSNQSQGRCVTAPPLGLRVEVPRPASVAFAAPSHSPPSRVDKLNDRTSTTDAKSRRGAPTEESGR